MFYYMYNCIRRLNLKNTKNNNISYGKYLINNKNKSRNERRSAVKLFLDKTRKEKLNNKNTK